MNDTEPADPLAGALKAAKRHFWAAGLFSGLVNILYLAPSIFMLQVYDRVVPSRGGATLIVLIAILTGALAVFAALDLVRMRLLLRASVRLEKLAAPAILHRVLGASGAASKGWFGLIVSAVAVSLFPKLVGSRGGRYTTAQCCNNAPLARSAPWPRRHCRRYRC